MDNYFNHTSNTYSTSDEKKFFELSSLNSKLSLTESMSFSNYFTDLNSILQNNKNIE